MANTEVLRHIEEPVVRDIHRELMDAFGTRDGKRELAQHGFIAEEQNGGLYHPVHALIRGRIKEAFGQNPVMNPGNVIEKKLTEATALEKPVHLVSMWGRSGKYTPDEGDYALMDFFASLKRDIGTVHTPGAKVTVIIADVHGNFNGYDEAEKVSEFEMVFPPSYHQQIEDDLHQHGIESVKLSTLYSLYNLEHPNQTQIDEEKDSKAIEIFNANKHEFISGASAHNKAGFTAEEAGLRYVKMRVDEWDVLADAYPDSLLMFAGKVKLNKKVLPPDHGTYLLPFAPPWLPKPERSDI